MAFAKHFAGSRRVAILAALMVGTLAAVLPTSIQFLSTAWMLNTDHGTQIDTVGFESANGASGTSSRIVGNLFHAINNLTKKCPAIIACPGDEADISKESIAQWAMELAKRGYVVLTLDPAGFGSSIGQNTIFPDVEVDPNYIRDGIAYLKTLPYVNASAIGLMGIGYGGIEAALAAGVLGNLINATVIINGAMNVTDWLVREVLPNTFKIPASQIIVYPDRIETGLTLPQKIAFLNLVHLYRGEVPLADDLFLPNSTALDRSTLRKMDPVEVLPSARPNSVMFLHGSSDMLFAPTNQSGQGVLVTPGAVDILVNDDESLSNETHSGDNDAGYALVNFFDVKLKGVILPNESSDYGTYTQKQAGDPGFSDFPVPTLQLFYIMIGEWVIAAILAGAVINLLIYEKRYKSRRIIMDEAKFVKLGPGEDPNPEEMQLVRPPRYSLVFFMLAVMLVIFYIGFTAGTLGIITTQVTGTFLVIFYVANFLAILYLPNDSELRECQLEVGRNATQKDPLPMSWKSLATILGIVALAGLFGATFTGDPQTDIVPGASLLRVTFFAGVALVSTAIGFLLLEKRRLGTEFSLERYHLSRARLMRGLALGLLVFLNIAMIWEVTASWIKMPFPLVPHTLDYIFGLFGVVLFALGIEVWVEAIIRSRFPTDGLLVPNRVRPRLKVIGLGCVVVFIATFATFLPILLEIPVPLASSIANVNSILGFLVGILPVLFPLLLVGGFLLVRGVNLLAADREVTFTAVFYPLVAFWILAFFFHI